MLGSKMNVFCFLLQNIIFSTSSIQKQSLAGVVFRELSLREYIICSIAAFDLGVSNLHTEPSCIFLRNLDVYQIKFEIHTSSSSSSSSSLSSHS